MASKPTFYLVETGGPGSYTMWMRRPPCLHGVILAATSDNLDRTVRNAAPAWPADDLSASSVRSGRWPCGPLLIGVVSVLLVGLVGCADGGRADRAAAPSPFLSIGPSSVMLDPTQRRVADELVSVFENGTTQPRYDYVEDLRDGRGYTCGKIGFTTSSTEVRDVVEAYVAQQPGSVLARHVPQLRLLAAKGRGDTAGLAGFPQDWAAAAGDPTFRAIQDSVADRLTFMPAVAAARGLGIRTALGVGILFDTAVQHGTGDDPDGMAALIGRATTVAGGRPADGIAELHWLMAFLDVRADDLRNPHNAATQRVWAESVDRVQALRRLVVEGHHDLVPPLTVTVFGGQYELR
jgi:chitosanase